MAITQRYFLESNTAAATCASGGGTATAIYFLESNTAVVPVAGAQRPRLRADVPVGPLLCGLADSARVEEVRTRGCGCQYTLASALHTTSIVIHTRYMYLKHPPSLTDHSPQYGTQPTR